jgi:hypothetical protein
MVNLKEIEEDLYDLDSRKDRNDEYVLNRQSKIQNSSTPINYPDAKMHQIISFIKSGIRIGGYLLLAVDQLVACAFVLILSEMIGIYEELV